MRVVSLFSGIGAHDLGLEWAGMQIVGQVEIDEYCTKILEKHWPKVKRWRDITTVSANDIRRLKPDLITGGFPCQDISTAGKQKGIVEGERSGLWREMWRLIRDVRPDWVLIENVPALRTNGADIVLGALEAIGYSWWAFVVGAIHAGAPHRRQRVFIVANNAGSQRVRVERGRLSRQGRQSQAIIESPGADVGDSDGQGQQHALRCRETHKRWPQPIGRHQDSWEQPRTIERSVGGSVNGTSRRLALKALGNANPPQVVAMIGRAIMHVNGQ